MTVCYNDVMEKYNSWTIVKDLPSKTGRRMVLARCECGVEKEHARTNIVSGKSRMCRECSNKNRPAQLGRRSTGTHLAARSAYYGYKTKVNKEVAKGRAMPFEITYEEFYSIVQKDCFYCGGGPSNISKVSNKPWAEVFYYNGIDRVNNDLGYVSGNMVPCCAVCNRMKRDMNYIDFIIMADRIVERHVTRPQMLMPREFDGDDIREAIKQGGVPMILSVGQHPKKGKK